MGLQFDKNIFILKAIQRSFAPGEEIFLVFLE